MNFKLAALVATMSAVVLSAPATAADYVIDTQERARIDHV